MLLLGKVGGLMDLYSSNLPKSCPHIFFFEFQAAKIVVNARFQKKIDCCCTNLFWSLMVFAEMSAMLLSVFELKFSENLVFFPNLWIAEVVSQPVNACANNK